MSKNYKYDLIVLIDDKSLDEDMLKNCTMFYNALAYLGISDKMHFIVGKGDFELKHKNDPIPEKHGGDDNIFIPPNGLVTKVNNKVDMLLNKNKETKILVLVDKNLNFEKNEPAYAIDVINNILTKEDKIDIVLYSAVGVDENDIKEKIYKRIKETYEYTQIEKICTKFTCCFKTLYLFFDWNDVYDVAEHIKDLLENNN